MRIIISKKDFLASVKNIFDLSKKLNKGVLLAVANGSMSVIGFNEDIIEKLAFSDITIEEEGSVVVSFDFFSIVKSIAVDKEDAITLYTENSDICILYNSSVTKSPIKSITEWKQALVATSSYASNPPILKLDVNPLDLFTMYSAASFATTSTDYRNSLTGVLLQTGGTFLRLLSGDGYRVAFTTLQLPNPVAAYRAVVPKKLFLEAKKYYKKGLKTITLSLSITQLSFTVDKTTIAGKLIEDPYPDYATNLPQPAANPITINADELRKQAKTIDTIKPTFLIVSVDSNTLTISATSQNGEYKETVNCLYSGQPIEFKIDTKHLLDYLSTEPVGNIIIHTSTPDKPIMFYTIIPDTIQYTYTTASVK